MLSVKLDKYHTDSGIYDTKKDNSMILLIQLILGVNLQRELAPKLPHSDYMCEYLH